MKKFISCFLILCFCLGVSYGQINLPVTGSATHTTCSNQVYDNGGSGSNYSINCDGYVVIYPSNTSMKVQVSGSFTTETNYDYLYIYNGAGTGGTLLGTYNGTGAVPVTQSSGANIPLTIRFVSDGSVAYSGFELNVSCVATGAPTTGDCLGAIPICTNSYNPAVSAVGIGNYADVLSGVTPCGTFEKNSTWYTFTVQTAGWFTFNIGSSVDYDFALYDLTNNSCYDIMNQNVNSVRCNWSQYIETNPSGVLGTGLHTSASNANEGASGYSWSSAIYCNAGQQFALLIDNYTGGATNYWLQFNPGGGAGIIDNTGPSLGNVTPPSCGSNTLTFQFSESVNCSSVAVTDLDLTGPGGPYTLSNIVGLECSTGALYGQTFTVNVSPPLITSGNFVLAMDGSISDQCNNPTNTTVTLPFVITNVTTSATVSQTITCNGASTGALTANPTGGTPPYTYAWSSSPAQSTQTATNLPAGSYNVTATDQNGCSGTASASLTQPSALTPGVIANNQSVCYNSTPAILTSSSNASGGTGSIVYQWQSTTVAGCASGWTDITGATGPTYTPGVLTQTTCFRRRATDNCTSQYSNAITVTVNTLPVITGAVSTNVTICGGSNGTISITATGATPLFYSIDGGSSFVANGGNFSGLPNGNYPIAIRDNNGCIVYGTTLSISAGSAPPAPAAGTSDTYCYGEALANLTATAGNGGTLTWYSDPALNNIIATASFITPFNNIGTTDYYVTETVSNCESVPTTITITINPLPVADLTPASETICSGSTSSISLSSTVNGTTFSWTATQAGVSGAANGTGNFINQTLSTTASNVGTVIYTITPSANGCTGSTSTATVYVNPIPNVSATPSTQTICSGSSTSISLSSTVGSTVFDWTTSLSGVTGGSDGTGSTISQTLTTTGTTQGSVVYTITPTFDVCPGNPINVTINVNPIPVLTVSPSTPSICSGSSTGMTLSSNVTGTNYSWTVTQNNTTGASSGTGSSIDQILNTTSQATGTATYSITPSASSCNGTPVDVVVTVNPVPSITATPSSQTICTYDATNILLTSNVTGAGFSWTYSTANVLGASDGNGSSITQILGNPALLPETITYNITSNYFNCSSLPLNVVVTVNPYPVIDPAILPDTICSGDALNIPLASNVAGTSFSWIANQSNTSGANTGNGSVINDIITAPDPGGFVDYFVIPSAYGCNGLIDTINVVVNPGPVIVSEDTTYVTYCGGSDGAIEIVATGLAPLEYSIDNGATFVQNGGIFTNLALGAYNVAVRNVLGCITYGSVLNIAEVGAPPAPVAGTNATYCTGDVIAPLFANTTAGGAVNWYSNPSLTNILHTGTSYTPTPVVGTNTYYVTETTGGCQSDPTIITIIVKTSPVANITPASQTICSGGLANLSIASSPANATFAWTVIQNNVTGASDGTGTSIVQTLTNSFLTPGTAIYTITPTLNGCIGSTTDVTVTVNPLPVVTLDLQSAVCQNTMSVSLIGGSPAGGVYSGPGVTGGSFYPAVGLGQHSLTYTYTDGNTCTNSATDIITVVANPSVALAPFEPVCNGSAPLVLTGGSPSGGTYLGNGVSSGSFDPVVAGLGSHTISYTFTDTNNCSGSATGSITVAPLPMVEITFTTPVSCFGMYNGTALANSVSGTSPYSYEWDNLPVSYTATATGLYPNQWYHVTVTDVNGCADIDSVLLPEPALLTFSAQSQNPTCGLANGSVGVIPAGGTTPYLYNWTNYSDSTGNSLTNIPAGVYFVTITDANGCTEDTMLSIATSPSVVANFIVTNPLCYSTATGSIIAAMTSGVAPFSYLWSTGDTTSTMDSLTAGQISVTITDFHNCSFSDTVNFTEPSDIVLNDSVVDAKCYGSADGKIQLFVTGGVTPYTYQWFPNTGDSVLIAGAGVYSVTVTDANNCSKVISDTIGQPLAPLFATLVVDSAKCWGDSTGRAKITVTGGTSDYYYIWSTVPIQTTNTAYNLTAGNYTVTVLDHYQCMLLTSLEVKEPSKIEAILAIDSASCVEGNDGLIIIHSSGGFPPYSYRVYSDPQQTDSIAVNLFKGYYSIKITDRTGCFRMFDADIPNRPVPCLEIPTVFTPNEDGIHDLWNIRNIHLYPKATIEVYNRWGNLIYQAGPLDKRWDGKYNGVDCPSGSYVYIIDLGNGTKVHNGTVTIVR